MLYGYEKSKDFLKISLKLHENDEQLYVTIFVKNENQARRVS